MLILLLISFYIAILEEKSNEEGYSLDHFIVKYIKPNENEAIDDVQKFVKIIIDFITKVKHFYPQAFEYNYEYILKNVEPI